MGGRHQRHKRKRSFPSYPHSNNSKKFKNKGEEQFESAEAFRQQQRPEHNGAAGINGHPNGHKKKGRPGSMLAEESTGGRNTSGPHRNRGKFDGNSRGKGRAFGRRKQGSGMGEKSAYLTSVLNFDRGGSGASANMAARGVTAAMSVGSLPCGFSAGGVSHGFGGLVGNEVPVVPGASGFDARRGLTASAGPDVHQQFHSTDRGGANPPSSFAVSGSIFDAQAQNASFCLPASTPTDVFHARSNEIPAHANVPGSALRAAAGQPSIPNGNRTQKSGLSTSQVPTHSAAPCVSHACDDSASLEVAVREFQKTLDNLPEVEPGTFVGPESIPTDARGSDGNVPKAISQSPRCALDAAAGAPNQISVPPKPVELEPLVFVWDLDETLILGSSLTAGMFHRVNKDLSSKKLWNLGDAWKKAAYYVGEKFMFQYQVTRLDRMNAYDLVDHDDGIDLSDYDFYNDNLLGGNEEDQLRKLSYRYRLVREFYKKGIDGANIADKYTDYWDKLWDETDKYCKGWLHAATNLLEATQEGYKTENGIQPVKHVIVTAGALIPSIVKVMLYKFDKFFAIEDIHSSFGAEDGKFTLFEKVRDLYGPNCKFCAIGDGPYEEMASAENGWPFVRISLAAGFLPTVGESGGLDILGRFGWTPMCLTPELLSKAIHTKVPMRHRSELNLSFRESSKNGSRKRREC